MCLFVVSFLWFLLIMFNFTANGTPLDFEGRFFSGNGDEEYLQLLDISRRMFDPDPEYQNMPMLYTPLWNGFIEGPTWDAWWILNIYGTTYCALPFYSGGTGNRSPIIFPCWSGAQIFFFQEGIRITI